MTLVVAHSGSGRGFQVSTIDTSGDKINSAATGSTFIIGVNSDPSVSLTGVRDNMGNSFLQFGADQLEPTGGGGTRLRLYKCENGLGGTGHYASADFGAATWPTMFLLEVLDTGKIVTVDTSSLRQASDSSSPYTVTSGTFDAATTLALLFVADSMDGNSVVKTESTGFTKVAEEQDNDHYWTGAVWSKAISSTSALTPSVTQSGGTSITGFALAVFGLKSSGGALCALNVTDAADALSASAAASIVVQLGDIDAMDSLAAAVATAVLASSSLSDATDSLASTAVIGAAPLDCSLEVTEEGDMLSAVALSKVAATLGIADGADVLVSHCTLHISPRLDANDEPDALASTASVQTDAALRSTDSEDLLEASTSAGALPAVLVELDVADRDDVASSNARAEVLARAAIADVADLISGACESLAAAYLASLDSADVLISTAIVSDGAPYVFVRDERTYRVPAQSRVLHVRGSDRVYHVPPQNRTYKVRL